jgi:phosphate:Na+ symporter
MTGDLLSLLGGIGMFLFGMQTMTGALRQLASRRARAALARFTRTPLSGVVTGAATTAVIQSSSATVMTTIGFVGAGLMTFPQALGVIFGANVGTTFTGWMVAILGLKFDLGAIALPLLLAASLLAALGRGRWELAGRGTAGFSLVFIGLGLMQAGTAALDPLLAVALSVSGGPWGILLLVGLGAVVTAIIQSSSAGVAATLVLLNGGSLTLVEAAALVIGMDLGTTFKSVVATIGGSTAMRRTAAAHVGYNLATCTIAIGLLGIVPVLGRVFDGDAPTALVVFHTLFNIIGVVLLLPFVGRITEVIERLVPQRGGAMPEPLDRSLLAEPAAAIDAARVALGRIAAALFDELSRRVTGRPARLRPEEARQALDGVEAALGKLELPAADMDLKARHAALLHLVDHLHRLIHRLEQDGRIAVLRTERLLARPARLLALAADRGGAGPFDADFARRMRRLHALVAGRTGRLRRGVLLQEHAGLVEPGEVFEITDALRWLDRVALHVERIAHHGGEAGEDHRPAPYAQAG